MDETPRKLRKSKDRMICGVGILFYILLAILMPAPAGNSG